MFSACLALDIRRQAHNHSDCLPCVSSSDNGREVPELSFMQRMMKKHYAPKIASSRGLQVTIVVAFLALAAVSAAGISQIKEGLPLTDLAPRTHFAHHYLTHNERWVACRAWDACVRCLRSVQSDPPPPPLPHLSLHGLCPGTGQGFSTPGLAS